MAKPQYKAPAAQPVVATPATVAMVEPKATVASEKVRSGRYRVKGPGGLHANGRSYVAGDTVELSARDANSVSEHVEMVE